MCFSLFIYLPAFFYHAEPEPRHSCGGDRQVHYMSQEFKVILCLLCLLSGAPASLRYSNARSRIAKSSPHLGARRRVQRLRRNVMKKSARD